MENESRLKIEDLLETVEVNTKLEIQTMKDNLRYSIGDQTDELMGAISQIKVSLANAGRKLDSLDERVSDVTNETYGDLSLARNFEVQGFHTGAGKHNHTCCMLWPNFTVWRVCPKMHRGK